MYTPIAMDAPTYLRELKYPRDFLQIAFLSIDEKIAWISSLEPQEWIDLSLDKNFVLFWNRFYILPLRIKRTIYKLKFW